MNQNTAEDRRSHTGAFVGAFHGGSDTPRANWGNLAAVIDPGTFIDRKIFLKEAADVITRLKSLQRRAGVEEVLYPGERGERRARQALASGKIELDSELWRSLVTIAES